MLYSEKVVRLVPTEFEEHIEVPETLVRLVNSRDKKFGRNGYHCLGCNRVRQGGYTIDRLREYIQHHSIYHIGYGHPCDCPIVL